MPNSLKGIDEEINILKDEMVDLDTVDNELSDNIKTVSESQTSNHISTSNKKHDLKANDIIFSLTEKISQMNKDMKTIKNEMNKLLIAYNYDIKKVTKYKFKKGDKKRITGFMKPKSIPSKLEEYLDLKKGTKMTRNEIVKMMYKRIQDSSLIYDKDGRVFRANNELMKLFNLNKTVNDSVDPKDKDGFNFYNFQKHIANLYKEEDEKKKNNTNNTIIKKKKKKNKNKKTKLKV